MPTEVRNVATSPGRLEFEVGIDGRSHSIGFTIEPPVTPWDGAVLPAVLVPAMTQRSPLQLPVAVDARVRERLPELQGIFAAWGESWAGPAGELRPVDVVAPEVRSPPAGEGVAAFFSGGVDSMATVVAHPEITHLVSIAGFDFPTDSVALAASIRDRLSAAADALGKEWIWVETDARAFGDSYVSWEAYYGPLLVATAYLLAPVARRFYVASEAGYHYFFRRSASPMIDHLWSTSGLEMVHDGGRLRRIEKLIAISEFEVAARMLRVCWENRDSQYNCCRCEKCLRTMVPLACLDRLDAFETFPLPLDLDAVAALPAGAPNERHFWRENLGLAEERGKDRHAAAIRLALGNGSVQDSPERIAELEAEVAELGAALTGVRRSASWRLTTPLRSAKTFARGWYRAS